MTETPDQWLIGDDVGDEGITRDMKIVEMMEMYAILMVISSTYVKTAQIILWTRCNLSYIDYTQ